MGAVVSTVTSLFKKPKVPKFEPPTVTTPEPVAPTRDSAIEGQEDVRRKNKKKKGRTSTILTGLLSDDSQVGSTVILGG